MHQVGDDEPQTNATKTTLSTLRATLAAKENPEPYTGLSAPTPITRSSYSAQQAQTQNLDILTPVSKNLQPGSNHSMKTTHRETKTYRFP